MGLLWRMLAPKPLKKTRRSVRKVAHPVRAITPKPIKKARRAVNTVVHPWEAAEFAVENQIVRAVNKSRRQPARKTGTDSPQARFRDPPIERAMPPSTPPQESLQITDMSESRRLPFPPRGGWPTTSGSGVAPSKALATDSAPVSELEPSEADEEEDITAIERHEQLIVTPVRPSAAAPITPIEQLEKLAALHTQGFVTVEEFAAKKKELLGL